MNIRQDKIDKTITTQDKKPKLKQIVTKGNRNGIHPKNKNMQYVGNIYDDRFMTSAFLYWFNDQVLYFVGVGVGIGVGIGYFF